MSSFIGHGRMYAFYLDSLKVKCSNICSVDELSKQRKGELKTHVDLFRWPVVRRIQLAQYNHDFNYIHEFTGAVYNYFLGYTSPL